MDKTPSGKGGDPHQKTTYPTHFTSHNCVIMSEQMIWARKALIEIHTLSLRAC